MEKVNEEIQEIRRIRREISAEFGHDSRQLFAYYRELEKELRASGKYKFAAPVNPKTTDLVQAESAD